MIARHLYPAVRWCYGAALSAFVISLACLSLEQQATAQGPVNASASLEKVFADQAAKLLEHFRSKNYKNVGVLKFRVQKGTEKPSDNVGPLNMALADKLQKALILKNSNKKEDQVGIIRDATTIAFKTQGANHLQQGAGRQKLFDAQYPLAWGNQTVKADAFIFGTARLEPNFKEMTVALFAIDAEHVNGKCEQVMKFNASTDVSTLVDAGESFALRGVFGNQDNNTPPPSPEKYKEQIAESAAKVHSGAEKYPLKTGECPVSVEVYYGNRQVAYDLQGGKALIEPPKQGQPVYFCIKRNAPGTYGVVLKVNGINTVYEEKFPADQCTKWILEPNVKEIKVEGYYLDTGNYNAFRVGSPQESRENEINYGEDVGQIAFTVFREKYVGQSAFTPPTTPPGDDGAEEDAIRGATMPKDAKNLGALKTQLLEGAKRGGTLRGLILAGEQKAGKVHKVNFEPHPEPILSATITYYKKTGGGGQPAVAGTR